MQSFDTVLPDMSPCRVFFKEATGMSQLRSDIEMDLYRGRGTGGALGAKAPPLFECEVNVPFSWIESALFSWNRSALSSWN